MAQDLFVPQADTVDGELFIETPATARASRDLWQLLGLSRQQPRPWIPLTVLCGESGSGRTTLARRFIRAAQRNIACDFVEARVAGLADEEAKQEADARRHAASWAEHMVRDFGNCATLCRPATWAPEAAIQSALAEASIEYPALSLEMTPRPEHDHEWLTSRHWRSPGNATHHATRRTSLVFADNADRFLSVSPSRRRECLGRILNFENRARVGHPLTWVFIGSPALVDVLREYGATQAITVAAMANDADFAEVCAMIFGTRDAKEIAELHRQSAGLLGRLTHIARMRGFEPPYRIRPEEIRKLPAPPKKAK